MDLKLFAKLSELAAVPTAHLAGTKKVFLSSGDAASKLTQFAFGELAISDLVESHLHPTMEEFFFFLQGTGTFYIADKKVKLQKEVFVYVPANTPHHIINSGEDKLQFVYFGVAL